MADSAAYERLKSRASEVQLVADSQALLSWDQEVLMPRNGVAYRARQMAWFSGWIHEQTTSREWGEWISEAEEAYDTSATAIAANLREWRYAYDRATRLSKEWVEEFAKVQVEAKSVWADAREKSDFSLFAPSLQRLINLCKEEAEHYGYEECRYDALVQKFERGGTTARLDEVLGGLRGRLVPLVERATAKEPVSSPFVEADFPIEGQRILNQEIAESIGFDFDAGRIDTAVHPFCSGMAPRDVRLTTRYDEKDFLSYLFGVLHETGHGLYEQGISGESRGQPVGTSASLGVHESQSRLWENHVGRSLPFWEKWLPRASEIFPVLRQVSPEEMFRHVNEAKLTHIRVEADEVTYDLHILLRFELEKELFSGELSVGELPGEWNRRFEEYFGIPVQEDSQGCLQDIHWSMGIFGYFPTYSLGNINAAHLMRAAREDVAVETGMEQADYGPLLNWMRERIHQQGATFFPDDLIARAAGSPADSDALIAHLESRYL